MEHSGDPSRTKPCEGKKINIWPTRFTHQKVESIARRLKRIFDSLPHLGYLGDSEIADYRYYEQIIAAALAAIDSKAGKGELSPLDTKDYPKVLRYPHGIARVALYIGTFDPFQLTHLSIALRLLASEKSNTDVVVVIPEGSVNAVKLSKTDYNFRFQIARQQLVNLFEPFIIPLDIGSNADTIEIVRRFIAMHTGMRLELTHLIGSDVLPIAARFIDEDLCVWKRQAQVSGVDYSHAVHVSRRATKGILKNHMEEIRLRNVPVYLERKIVGTPSSTDFRENRAITLVLPTESIRDKLEILFRYNMNQPWSTR
jgi:nicotinic acid mononucleotide adenylyltransferase